LKVRHTSAETREEAKKFRKSKYIKSDTYEAYSLAKKALQEGKKVLFTGTGCQIAGLKGFLQKDYENLLTVDLVCHGVPSQLSFDKYIEGLERKYKKKIVDYTFRAKKKFNGEVDSLSINVIFEDKSEKDIQGNLDFYFRSFLADISLMPSCYNCSYATTERTSDITIADFWGISNFDKSYNETTGTSLIIANTDKGKQVVDNFEDVRMSEFDIEKATMKNSSLLKPKTPHKKREEFLTALQEGMPFDKAVNKYAPISFKTKLKRTVKKVLPQKLIRIIRKIK
jgi:coenzyme F420-reducing hydrogenase beta subunit